MTNKKPTKYYAVFEVGKDGERVEWFAEDIKDARATTAQCKETYGRKRKFIIRELVPGEVVK